MITTETNYQAIFQVLPPEAVVTLYNVSWEEYEALLNEFDEQPRLRLTYDNGRLDIMTVSLEHERIKDLLPHIILVLAMELNLNFLGIGSITLRKKKNAKGADPDDCYYFKNFKQISSKKRLDLSVDPPPDLAIEVDITNRSTSKFSIYAALGVAELWRHTGAELFFYELDAEDYFEVPHSRLFPFLTPAVLLRFLQMGEAEGAVVMANEFRAWVQANKA
jgi:Uma2 family endonuclease